MRVGDFEGYDALVIRRSPGNDVPNDSACYPTASQSSPSIGPESRKSLVNPTSPDPYNSRKGFLASSNLGFPVGNVFFDLCAADERPGRAWVWGSLGSCLGSLFH